MSSRLLKRNITEWLFIFCGVWLVGLGLYFVFVRPPLLPEDVRYMGADANVVEAALPGLAAWLGKVFTVMGGFMATSGVLVTFIGWRVLPTRPRGGAVALSLAGLLSVGLMSAVNFVLHSDSQLLLAVPPLFWLGAVIAFARKG